MSVQSDYNRVYSWHRLTLQILLKSQRNGIVIDLLPQIALSIKNRLCVVAVGVEWICGSINLGVMNESFQKSEAERRRRVRELAKKSGITARQQELRWGW